MEWEPKEQDTWVSDAQRWICQIKGVLQCKIDLDNAGEIAGVHVVAGMERDPRHIVRDVEGLLKARLDIDVYYKKIGVVQVVDSGPPNGTQTASTSSAVKPRAKSSAKPKTDAAAAAVGNTDEYEHMRKPTKAKSAHQAKAKPAPQAVSGSAVTFHPPSTGADEPQEAYAMAAAPTAGPVADSPSQSADTTLPDPIPAILVAEDMGARVVCSGVGVMASDSSIRAEVELRAGNIEASGLREGANHADADLQLVAEATVAAVSELLADPVLLHLKEVRVEHVGGQAVVLTAVDLVEGRHSTTLFGTCSTSHNRLQAVVYSVLDALNRRLALHGLKTLEGRG